MLFTEWPVNLQNYSLLVRNVLKLLESLILIENISVYFSPSGCTFWGKKPWSRKKKILWQLGTLVGAPVGITLVAGLAVPAMLIGIPIWVGRKVTHLTFIRCLFFIFFLFCILFSSSYLNFNFLIFNSQLLFLFFYLNILKFLFNVNFYIVFFFRLRTLHFV